MFFRCGGVCTIMGVTVVNSIRTRFNSSTIFIGLVGTGGQTSFVQREDFGTRGNSIYAKFFVHIGRLFMVREGRVITVTRRGVKLITLLRGTRITRGNICSITPRNNYTRVGKQRGRGTIIFTIWVPQLTHTSVIRGKLGIYIHSGTSFYCTTLGRI